MADVVSANADAATQVSSARSRPCAAMPFDDMAFPSFGVPAFCRCQFGGLGERLWRSPGRRASSSGARGVGRGRQGSHADPAATAASTAARPALPYDYARLLADPAFNTQLGAAFLGAGHGGRRRFAGDGRGRLQRGPVGSRSGSPPTATHATAPIWSTGSSASRSTRHAIMCSGSARTSASTASASYRTRRRSGSSRVGSPRNSRSRRYPPGSGLRERTAARRCAVAIALHDWAGLGGGKPEATPKQGAPYSERTDQ